MHALPPPYIRPPSSAPCLLPSPAPPPRFQELYRKSEFNVAIHTVNAPAEDESTEKKQARPGGRERARTLVKALLTYCETLWRAATVCINWLVALIWLLLAVRMCIAWVE